MTSSLLSRLWLLLKFVQDSGKFSFKPVLPVNSDGTINGGTPDIAKTFTNDNIIQGSFSKSYYDTSLRKPFCALMPWREQFMQNYSSLITSEVRYSGTAVNGPFETYDYSDFITDVNHASRVGNYILSSRARVTHEISFSTYLDSSDPNGKLAGELGIMDIIRVDQTSGSDYNSSGFYQIESIEENHDGSVSIEAVHFPADEGGASLIVADILSSTPPIPPVAELPGGVRPPDPVVPPVKPPSGTIGILSIAPTGYVYAKGTPISFRAAYDGDVTDVVFRWFGPPGTNAPISTTTGPVLAWTAGGAEDNGAYSVVAVSLTAADSGKQVSAVLDYQPFYRMTGGSVKTDGDFKIHTFTSGGTLSIEFAPDGAKFEYLICGLAAALKTAPTMAAVVVAVSLRATGHREQGIMPSLLESLAALEPRRHPLITRLRLDSPLITAVTAATARFMQVSPLRRTALAAEAAVWFPVDRMGPYVQVLDHRAATALGASTKTLELMVARTSQAAAAVALVELMAVPLEQSKLEKAGRE